ncbi:MAG: hypothetical protein WB707_12225 [Candidatus Acidiferrales bacterium]
MAKTLPFGEIKLASLQRSGISLELFFRALALLNIQTRSIPLYDVAALIPKRHLAMKHPAVFSICPPDTSLVFEDLSGREAGQPFLNNPVKIFGMNEILPIPAAHLFQCGAQIFQPGFIEVIEVAVGRGRVDERGNRIDEKLNVQRPGLLSCGSHGAHYIPFECF